LSWVENVQAQGTNDIPPGAIDVPVTVTFVIVPVRMFSEPR
jgi:hypothetical protein